MRKIIVIILSCLVLIHSAYAETAEEILNKTGVKGGLIVHINCGDGKLTADLGKNKRFIVHGLDAKEENIKKARQHIYSLGIYGRISAVKFNNKDLPYTENLVNLIICEDPGKVSLSEIMRVLVPNGTAYIKRNNKWQIKIKPRPKDIDEWTHFLHGPDNNAVARDTVVGQPRQIQWVGPPKFGRSHEELASISALVSAGGRIFYISDEGHPATLRFPADWKLVAQDAFNGALLWKKPIKIWTDHLRHFRAGPLHLPRRLVASGEMVYVTLGLAAPVTALDAATGKIIRTYKGTESTEEIIFHDGTLYLVVGSSENDAVGGEGLSRRNEPVPTQYRYITALNAKTGKMLWKYTASDGFIIPLTLGVKQKRLFFQTTGGITCLDRQSGKKIWRTPRQAISKRMAWSAPTLVAHKDVVLLADREVSDEKSKEKNDPGPDIKWAVHGWDVRGFKRKGKSVLTAYSAENGKELWQTLCKEGYNSPVDIFITGGLAWIGTDFSKGHDLKTGEIKKTISTKADPVGMSHHRCYRNKASSRYIFTGRHGVEFISFEEGWKGNNSWIRGTCQYGIMPCNGMIYAPPDACACALKAKLQGFNAVAPAKKSPKRSTRQKLEKGPAYKKTDTSSSEENTWPLYRHDRARSGAAQCSIPASLKKVWAVKVGKDSSDETAGQKLTQPVIAEGKVFTASVNTHTLYAFNYKTGKELWSFTAGGRIDTPPAIYQGMAIFGSRDGTVYALRASDGVLAWQFHAAPEEKLVGSYGQLESAWPVHGAVLLQNKKLFFTAGRSSYLDGGIYLFQLDPLTGRELSMTIITSLDPVTGKQKTKEKKGSFNVEGVLTDILSGDGSSIFLKNKAFNAEGKEINDKIIHLFTPTGFLDEEFFVRSYWMWGSDSGNGWGKWNRMGNMVPAGRILSFDKKNIYGYGRVTYLKGKGGHRGDNYHLFADLKDVKKLKPGSKIKNGSKKKKKGRKKFPLYEKENIWSKKIPVTVQAMVLASGNLVVAGAPDPGRKSTEKLIFDNPKEALDAFEGRKDGLLWVVSAADGSKISEIKLEALPVFDGMSAAYDKLFISLKNGKLICFGE